jgi:hypothetical protein
MEATERVEVEIVAHVTGSMEHCSHCQVFIDGAGIGQQVRQADLQSFPEDFVRDWQRLSDWIRELASAFPERLVIKIYDAQSLQGLWRSLTKGVRRYPSFIVDGKQKYQGWDHATLNGMIERALAGEH